MKLSFSRKNEGTTHFLLMEGDLIGEDIREYFHCNNFYEYILPEIKRILEN